MLDLQPELALIHEDVLKNPLAEARMKAMLKAIKADEVRTVNDEELSRLAEERWSAWIKWGEKKDPRDPDVIFNVGRWKDSPEAQAERKQKYPALVRHHLNGYYGLSWREDGNLNRMNGTVCTSAWQLHSVYGCPFRCAYCPYGQVVNVVTNIEEEVEQLDEWTNRNIWQTLWKWDNITDINCFEPEFDATRLFVDYFADKPRRYLLLYAGKSDNVDFMLDYNHKGKTLIQWSIAPETQTTVIEPRTADWKARIEAARKCQEAGYTVRYRFSPIAPVNNWREEYARLIELMFDRTSPDVVVFCFLGWMDLAALKSCIDTELIDPWALRLAEERQEETKGRHYGPFPHEVRSTVYRFLIDRIRDCSPKTPMALCLESERMWEEYGNELGLTNDGYLCTCGPVCTPGTSFYAGRRAWFARRAAGAE